MKAKVEYAARTAFHEERTANMVPAHIRAQVDAINEEIRIAADEQFARVSEVCQRAGLPIPERRG